MNSVPKNQNLAKLTPIDPLTGKLITQTTEKNLLETDLFESSPEQKREFLLYVFTPVFLAIGIGLLVAFAYFPNNADGTMSSINTTLSDWFKLWLGAFIGFVGSIVTYYFSKEK